MPYPKNSNGAASRKHKKTPNNGRHDSSLSMISLTIIPNLPDEHRFAKRRFACLLFAGVKLIFRLGHTMVMTYFFQSITD
ncbi:hypothetical protein [Peribacillus frigoritolerans]|uniref:hypothetical protein n=2 Tax=Peribacillus frigoritolerans TaxID=450367 RepID=UPI003B8AE34E